MKRKVGRPALADRKPLDGNPKVQFRLPRDEHSLLEDLGGHAWARQQVRLALYKEKAYQIQLGRECAERGESLHDLATPDFRAGWESVLKAIEAPGREGKN